MTALTPEHREYKERTLNQLQANLPLLEAKLAQESRPDVMVSLESQLNEMQAHIARLQRDLAEDAAGEPVADEFCQRIARALTKEKFHLARRYLNKLETIEPFYPGLERLRNEVETGHVSRRTRSIAQGTALPYGLVAFSAGPAAEKAETGQRLPLTEMAAVDQAERRGLRRFFQFHILMSCLVVSLILCVMTGVGGVTVLQWLIEGN